MDEPLDFRAAYEAHFGHVWRTLRRLGVPIRDLEDATHDVFVVFHRRLGEFDQRRSVRPWLSGIAYRVAADERRRAHRRHEAMDGEISKDHADMQAGPEERAATREASALVQRALDSLDLDKRVVFVMHELDQTPCPEIASVLGIPVNTAYSRLRLARQQFEESVRRLRASGGAP